MRKANQPFTGHSDDHARSASRPIDARMALLAVVRLLVLALVVFAVAVALSAPLHAQVREFAPAATELPAQLESVGIDQRLNAQLPLEISLVNEAGQPVRLGDHAGVKPFVLVLGYLQCPMLCNQVLNGLATGLDRVPLKPGTDFDVLFVSIDPTEGAPLAASKKELYVERYAAVNDEGWHFLTGEAAEIEKLAAAAGFRYQWDARTKQYLHASAILVATPEGKVSRYFYGIEFSPRDLRLGLVEASKGSIGSAVDDVLLYCFSYDPLTGRYSMTILTVLRFLAVLTVVGLVSYQLYTLRHELNLSRFFRHRRARP